LIIIDPRKGSGELLPYFRPYGIEVSEQIMDAGDFAFFGEGPDGIELMGFERKVITDLMTSKRDNRLQGFQLPNMSVLYPNFSHLIVEGIWRASEENGLIEGNVGGGWRALKPHMTYRELDHFLAELSYKRGVYVERTSGRAATVAYLVSRYKFFNEKVWTQHDRTEKVFAPCKPVEGAGTNRPHRAGFSSRTVPCLERQLMQVDGVGPGDAYWIARRYKSMEAFMGAGVEEIAEVQVERNTKEGRKKARLGPAKAKKLWEAERER
jgi:ERCC4-type nuclease